MTERHRFRCETCAFETSGKGLHWSDPVYQLWKKCPYKSEDNYHELKEEARIPEAIFMFTAMVGCASHSDCIKEANK